MDRDELLSNYVQNQVVNLPNLLNDKLFLNNNKLNERNELIQIKEYIDEFMDGNTFNRFIVLPVYVVSVKLHYFFKFMIIC